MSQPHRWKILVGVECDNNDQCPAEKPKCDCGRGVGEQHAVTRTTRRGRKMLTRRETLVALSNSTLARAGRFPFKLIPTVLLDKWLQVGMHSGIKLVCTGHRGMRPKGGLEGNSCEAPYLHRGLHSCV